MPLPPEWSEALDLDKDWLTALERRVASDTAEHPVYPPSADRYRAFELCKPADVRVVILGQDPYHGPGQAHGLAFSVLDGVKHPPSLRNIFKELESDVGVQRTRGDLSDWAEQGVLLLNTSLSVRQGQAGSHARWGWSEVATATLALLASGPARCFVLWGNHAQKAAGTLPDHHLIIATAHPSPLSARRGFFGSRPFSRINRWLAEQGESPIRW